MNWDPLIAGFLGAVAVSTVGAVVLQLLRIDGGRRASILGGAGVLGIWIGHAFLLPTVQAVRFPGEIRDDMIARVKAQGGNDRVAAIVVEAMDPLFHDPKLPDWITRNGATVDPVEKGIGRLAPRELEQLFQLRNRLAQRSPALCANLWKGVAEQRELAEVVAEGSESEAREYYQLSARAAKLEVDDEAPRIVWSDEADAAHDQFFDTLPLHEHAVVQRALDAGKDAAPGDACAALGIFSERIRSLPDATADVLRRLFLSPWLKQTVDPQREVRNLSTACKAKDLAGCERLGVLYHTGGSGLSRDLAKGTELWATACDGGNLKACLDLASDILVNGPSAEHARGIALLERACTDTYVMGCTGLGVIYAQGVDLPRDTKKAAELYRKACDGREVSGCRNLGVSYFAGAGVPLDFEKAVALFREVCDAGDQLSCSDLADCYGRGLGVEKSLASATTLYSKPCRAGEQSACDGLARLQSAGGGPSAPGH